ncbi:MAG: hypothetical protein J2P18_18415, partial [Nocardia sp.]|nr:hypothetical protein [Nocardia sp.]
SGSSKVTSAGQSAQSVASQSTSADSVAKSAQSVASNSAANDASSVPADRLADSPSGYDPDRSPDSAGHSGTQSVSPDHTGAYDAITHSPTLAGMSGGVGSVVTLGMVRGGAGAMSGAATGFRMPAGALGNQAVRAFGASSAEPEPEQTPSAPRRGVTAPEERMRRRRDQERKPSKAFVPGEPEEIPELIAPPALGIVGDPDYDDDPDNDDPNSA